MSPLLKRLFMYWNFAWGLRDYLREPIAVSRCQDIIAERLGTREDNLLNMVRKNIYPDKKSPYRALLLEAGCESGDMETLVRERGVDRALEYLAGKGVYVTAEEFKGRRAIKRGSRCLDCREEDFDNPFQNPLLRAETGASLGRGTSTTYDLDYLSEGWGVHQVLRLDDCGALDLPVGVWLPMMPGAGPVNLLASAKAGAVPEKWFSPVAESDFGPALKNRLGTHFLVRAARFFGTRLPLPEYVAPTDATRIARWMHGRIKNRGGCYMAAYVSAAVRIAESAKREGLDLSGAVFSVSSEPFTETKKREIEGSGARVVPMYASMEAGIVGLGCGCPSSADDYHLLSDSVALCRRRKEIPQADGPVGAFLWTSLLANSPKVLLNVESGDFGFMEERDCGCRLGGMGFGTHFSRVQSFEKLTSEGMSFPGVDLVKILEDTLPSEFGGRSTDYQLLEEEDARGRARLTVVAAPGLGRLDESRVMEVVLRELRKGSDARRMMTEIWMQSGLIRVKRGTPFATPRGKQLSVHIARHRR